MPKRIVTTYVRHLKEQPFYVILNTMAAIVFGILFMWLYIQNDRLHTQAHDAKIQATKTHKLVKQNNSLLNRVQNNRRDLIYRACRDQNSRNADSLVALRKLLRKSGVSKARQDQSFKETKILVDALVPHKNCVKLANNNVKPKNTKLKATN